MIIRLDRDTYLIYKDASIVEYLIDVMIGEKDLEDVPIIADLCSVYPMSVDDTYKTCSACGHSKEYLNPYIREIHNRILCPFRWRSVCMGCHPRLGKDSPMMVLNTDILSIIYKHFITQEFIFFQKSYPDNFMIDNNDVDTVAENQFVDEYTALASLIKNEGNILHSIMELSDSDSVIRTYEDQENLNDSI